MRFDQVDDLGPMEVAGPAEWRRVELRVLDLEVRFVRQQSADECDPRIGHSDPGPISVLPELFRHKQATST